MLHVTLTASVWDPLKCLRDPPYLRKSGWGVSGDDSESLESSEGLKNSFFKVAQILIQKGDERGVVVGAC